MKSIAMPDLKTFNSPSVKFLWMLLKQHVMTSLKVHKFSLASLFNILTILSFTLLVIIMYLLINVAEVA